jgi:hypothetical protein
VLVAHFQDHIRQDSDNLFLDSTVHLCQKYNCIKFYLVTYFLNVLYRATELSDVKKNISKVAAKLIKLLEI